MSRYEELDEELRRILDDGSASSQPAELVDLRAQLAQEPDRSGDMPKGTKVALDEDFEVAAPVRKPIAPRAPAPVAAPVEKVVDASQQSPDDLEMAYAAAQDRKSRAAEARERGGRQMIAALTRTPTVQSTPGPVDAVSKLMALRKDREGVRQHNESNRLGAAKMNFEVKSAAEKKALDEQRRKEDLEKDGREFEYRKEHDAASLAASDRHSAATLALAGANSNATQKNRAAEDLSGLRKEFNALPDVKSFTEVDASFKKIESAAINDSPAGDLALVTGFMKIIDPGSSVKEGEFANAENAGGVPDKIRARYNSIVNGERLAPAQRADFLKQAKALHDVHRERYDSQASRYRTLAERQGANPDDVIATAQASRTIVRNPKTGERRYLNADGSLGEAVK